MLGQGVGLGLAHRGDIQDAVSYARQADRRGFDSVWVHDSYYERNGVTYVTAIASAVHEIRMWDIWIFLVAPTGRAEPRSDSPR